VPGRVRQPAGADPPGRRAGLAAGRGHLGLLRPVRQPPAGLGGGAGRAALAHDNLGIAYAKTGDPERGRRAAEHALAIHTGLGDLPGIGSVLNNLVVAHDRAAASYREGLALATDLGFRWEEDALRAALDQAS
jgi:hypothetical protein